MIQWAKSKIVGAVIKSATTSPTLRHFLGRKLLTRESIFGGMLSRLEITASNLHTFEDYLQVGCGKIWASWKACDYVAQAVSDIPFIVTRKGSSEATSVPDLEKLLQKPNPFTSWSQMLYLWAFHIKLCGCAFWLKDQPNMDNQKPLGLYPLNPKRIRLVLDSAGHLAGFVYSVRGEQLPLELNEVIYFRRPHPNNDFWGLGDIEAGKTLFEEHLNRGKWSEKFWTNGASPSGVMVNNEEGPVDPTEWKKLKKEWQAEYGGVNNSGKTAWLAGKWKYEKLGMTLADMENIESTKYSIESIFQMHGVPLSVAGVRDAANYATARIDAINFKRWTVKPMVRQLEETLNNALVAGYGDFLIRFTVTGLVDLDEVVTALGPMFDRGVLSINELRQRMELPPLPDPIFDQHFLNQNYVPVELAGMVTPDATQGAASVHQNFLRSQMESAYLRLGKQN